MPRQAGGSNLHMTSRLAAEIQRLYRLPGDTPAANPSALPLVDAHGHVRTLVMAISRPADWPALSAVWRGVQADFEMPAPAIAVNGVDAYELWFSLAQPVSRIEAELFLQGLRERYLGAVKHQRLALRPSLELAANTSLLIPAPQGDSGNWSAFVAPDLAAVFGDEPLLDVPPGDDAQAELLSRLGSISPDAFDAALQCLNPATPVRASSPPLAPDLMSGTSALKGRFEDPRQFLLAVMNDASAPLALRIEAAKALMV